jgi:hypothetical protein
MKKNGIWRKVILFFLLFVFLSGIAFCLNPYITRQNIVETLQQESLERVMDTSSANASAVTTAEDHCPDILIRSGNVLHLFNSKLPQSETNPIVFENIDAYLQYADVQRREQGSTCPVLYLQEENNTQGETVFRARSSPTQLDPGNPVKVLDASQERKPFNEGGYQGFDAHGQQIGEYTQLDSIHDSTNNLIISENPMDPNWGGVLFSQSAIDSGKYESNEVGKQYMMPKVIEIYK